MSSTRGLHALPNTARAHYPSGQFVDPEMVKHTTLQRSSLLRLCLQYLVQYFGYMQVDLLAYTTKISPKQYSGKSIDQR